jgi:pyruvate,water dikinase
MPDDPFVRALTKFFGGPPPEAQAPNEVGGYAGAPGVVQGTARIARTLAEADRILPGEILVAPTTTPAWSTLFGYIGAIVTDSGGILSHCAVVAREYGIPAVVGTAMATAFLQDGQWIEVDGTHGVVRIL